LRTSLQPAIQLASLATFATAVEWIFLRSLLVDFDFSI
jgi:hypothetical protein